MAWRVGLFVGAVGVLPIFAAPAMAADVEISTSVTGGIVLDSYSGTTAQVDAGVTVANTEFTSNCNGSVAALCATTHAWTVTNLGTIGPADFGTGLIFNAGGAIINWGSLSGDNAITIEGGSGGSVDNKLGATISSPGCCGGIVIGESSGVAGTVTNAGTITSASQAISLWGGGTVTNLATGVIQAHDEANAVAVVGGTTRVIDNYGLIQSNDTGYGTGVSLLGGTLTNYAGAKILGAYNGIWTYTAATTITNYGLIEASKAVLLYGVYGSAIEMDAGGTITNSGTIRSLTSDSTTGDYGIYFSGAGSITNSGTIESTDGGKAIQFNGSAAHTLTLQTGSVLGGAVHGGSGTDALVLQGAGSEMLNRFSGFETIDMQGSHWTLSNAGTFTGGTTIDAGTLSIDGALTTSTLSVMTGGVLGGDGTVSGAVTVASGGKIAPGDSIGTLTVASADYQTGSTFEVEVDPSSADELVVTGTGTIDPAAQVSVLAAPGTYTDGQRFLILDAVTRNGVFASTVVDNSAFLAFTLDQTIANQVWLQVATVADFVDVAETPNQRAAAGGLQELGPGNNLFDAIAMLDAGSARHAFDLSSGEIHATIGGVLLDDSRFVRQAVLDRMSERFADAFDAPPLAFADDGVPPGPIPSAGPAVTMWGSGFGSWAKGAGDGNAAVFDRSIGGFIAGLDVGSEDAWRAGLAVGYQSSGIGVDERNSSASVDGYNVAAYGGVEEGPFAFRFGGALTMQSVDTTRQDVFSGFDETLTAHYGARTAQVFGEAGYHHVFGGLAVDPFVGLAGVTASTDGFTESGGLAALSAAPQTRSITLADFGARFAADVPVGHTLLQLTASVAWQHAFGDVTPTTDLAFAAGTPFTIAGVPIARDALELKAGVDWKLTPCANVGLAYSGQIASGFADHGVNAHLTMRF